jgi:hypothetical protein
MSARSHREVYIRARNPQLLEENLGHVDIEVLARVDESLHYVPPLFESVVDGGEFHEVGPGPDNVKYLHKFSGW